MLVMVAALSLGKTAASAEEVVNLYSYRQPFLIKPMLKEFTKKTGIKTNVVFAKKGMLEKIKATPGAADAVLTVDIGRLHDMDEAGLLQPVKSKVLEQNIPSSYRHPKGHWFGLTTRGRVIYASKKRVKPGAITRYEDLADPKWKGKICTRSGKHVYNVSLFASIVAHSGEAKARKWLMGLKSNLARKPQGNDRAQAKAIHAGECDLALANTYYMAKMATNKKKKVQREWAKSVYIVFPNQQDRGTHVNISGAAVAKHAKNRGNAVRLIEFLSGEYAQKLYADQNYEYPLKKGVKTHPLVDSWGKFKADTINLAEVANKRATASRLVDQVDYNNFSPSN
ncbi:MAG: Fe(3+) ABC transporter substrate-binding protein [Nitrospinae bacterium]|nr:Fe(3+) ABC transporter substrate-binding protein [Nitrospinota bacterium]